MSTDLTRRTCLGALALAGLAGPAARAAEALMDVRALQEDADLLRRAYTTLHPGLLRYQTASEAEARFARLRADFGRPQTLGSAYLKLARTTAAIRCGHSFPNPANQEGPGLSLISGARDRLPFRFAWLGGRMIVLDGLGAHPALRPGAEVESIDGVPCGRILRELMPLVPADGGNDAKRVRSLDLRGEENWPLFDVLLPLMRPDLVAGGGARLRVSGPGGGGHPHGGGGAARSP